ncbi:MAG: DoxX family protein [Bacteroidota bacterium]
MSWSPIQKLIFRFGSTYLLLFCLSNQFLTSELLALLWRRIIPWLGVQFLGHQTPIEIIPSGSGDTTYNYTLMLFFVVLSILVALAWSILDRHRPHYQKALAWLVVLVRYYIAYQMVLYGLAKIFYLQFPTPHFVSLLKPLGELTPMALLWGFMGYSKAYTMFTGWGELIGGIFLLFGRTTTLGALIVFGVMTNVLMLNFSYDVPVKILSSHLVLMALILILLDREPLWALFFAGEAVPTWKAVPLFKNPKWLNAKNTAKWLVISGLFFTMIVVRMGRMQRYGLLAEQPPLYGLYEVSQYTQNDTLLPPIHTSDMRWQYLAIDSKERATLYLMSGKRRDTEFIVDTTTQQIITNSTADTLSYLMKDTQLYLHGIFEGNKIAIELKRRDMTDFALTKRKFRWVQEHPDNNLFY